MKRSSKKTFSRAILGRSLLLSSSIILCCIATALAGSSISARYLEPRGTDIEWAINIPSPPPTAVIVTQYILPGSEILETSHPLNSYDKEKGIAKWLISPISPGRLRMNMKISQPIRKKGEIHGEVTFQDDTRQTTAFIFMPPRTKKRAIEGC